MVESSIDHALAPPPYLSLSPPVSGVISVPKTRRRNRMINSCLECRRRKLKCSKGHPCTNCLKSNRDCIFLAPADSAAQSKLLEIKEKVGSLELLLEKDVARDGLRAQVTSPPIGDSTAHMQNEPPALEDEKGLEPTPLAMLDALYDDDADDSLLELGIQLGKMRLTERLGGLFRPKISEELEAALRHHANGQPDLQQCLSEIRLNNTSSSNASSPEYSRDAAYLQPSTAFIVPDSSFIFGAASCQSSLLDFLPSRKAADRLVGQYFEAVYPVARALHRPTFEKQYATFWKVISVGLEPVSSAQAIVFAVMFSGVVSMDEDIIFQNFGVSKQKLVDNFRLGTEMALAKANFIRTTKVETMQAFVVYLIPMCRNEVSRAHSALTGTAIRIAECMGLHRDGENFGLAPIDVHLRRMIWYQLCFLDLRTCEAQGPRPGIRKEDFDTKLPLNIDDDDLLRSGSAAPQPAKGWTDMTYTNLRFECNEMHRLLYVDRTRLERKETSLTAVLAKIAKFKVEMEAKYTLMVDERIPIQRYAKDMLEMRLNGMHITVLHRYHNSVSQQMPERLRQIIITSGLAQVELSIMLESAVEYSQWAWYAAGPLQYHTALLLLMEVFYHPERREADRIWACIDYVFEVDPAQSREQRARHILTDLRDRSAVYARARKMRAPSDLGQNMNLAPAARASASEAPHFAANLQPPAAYAQVGSAMPLPQLRQSLAASASAEIPLPNAEAAWALEMQAFDSGPPPCSGEGAQGGGGATETAASMGGSMYDEFMPDIDWVRPLFLHVKLAPLSPPLCRFANYDISMQSEWDRIFPPHLSAGEPTPLVWGRQA
ncbi:MAG: hypothetical protein M1829_005282 [Trizodia sp. TS-e1964]|nr:MAG: hypothetical protein M1829_005282 [Trizodia sp. TS-e1964]